MILQTTLSLAAAAALITIWHMLRIGRLRASEKIVHGDGGNEALIRKMRAQSNFLENTPFVLILVAAIEMTEKGGTWLAIVGAVFMLGRVMHAIGMDGSGANFSRAVGTLIAMLTLVGLGVIAVLITFGRF
ncbi:MAG: MAPEG family protein [Sphingomonadaceae bacterium]|nr:MAPEG family protein [Sphingomonadaceae bacterium]